MPEKPDVYICQKCQNRFQKADIVSIEEDGLLITKPACPKCKSTELVASSIFISANE
ncbi:MAG: hypothetical protein ACTSRU_09790 [Candidatus Hodarchaeales archaeon]